MSKSDERLALNVGCGEEKEGDIRLDIFQTRSTNVIGDAQHLPFKDQVFTDIYERNLLEHMPNPALHLSEVRRTLRIKGVLNLITDNAACLKYYILRTHTGGYSKHNGKDRHYALFTMEHVRNLMHHAGLEIQRIEFTETNYSTWVFDRLVRLFAPSLSYPRISVRATRN